MGGVSSLSARVRLPLHLSKLAPAYSSFKCLAQVNMCSGRSVGLDVKYSQHFLSLFIGPLIVPKGADVENRVNEKVTQLVFPHNA